MTAALLWADAARIPLADESVEALWTVTVPMVARSLGRAGKRYPTAEEAMLLRGAVQMPMMPMIWSKTDPLIPYGAVVATCQLVDCLPMVEDLPPKRSGPSRGGSSYATPWPILFTWPGFGSAEGRYVGDRPKYGDFRPGRWAWMLDEIEAVVPPVPAVGRQRLWEWTP